MLRQWIKEHEQADDQAFRGNGKLSDEELEIRRLKEQARRLKWKKS